MCVLAWSRAVSSAQIRTSAAARNAAWAGIPHRPLHKNASGLLQESSQGAATKATHGWIRFGVVPDEPHRLLERPRHAPRPPELATAQGPLQLLTWSQVEQMPCRNEIQRGIGWAESAPVEYADEPPSHTSTFPGSRSPGDMTSTPRLGEPPQLAPQQSESNHVEQLFASWKQRSIQAS